MFVLVFLGFVEDEDDSAGCVMSVGVNLGHGWMCNRRVHKSE